MDPKSITLSERVRHKRVRTVRFHVIEALGQVKLIYCDNGQNRGDLRVQVTGRDHEETSW